MSQNTSGGGGNGGKPVGPVKAASREQAHPGAVTADDQSITIVLDFVYPPRAGRRRGSANWNARLNEPGGQHATFLHPL
jgi:hypothetical protein